MACPVEGCGRTVHARGFCNSHYMDRRARGILPILVRKPQPVTPMQRWCALVDLPAEPDGCWRWKGYVTRAGYAGFRYDGASRFGHKYGYERFIGPVPDGMELDHLCRNRACVNPVHLEAVTNGDNVRRGMGPPGINHRKTHCVRGHPFDSANTMLVPIRGRKNPTRRCRTCATEKHRPTPPNHVKE